MKWIYPEVNTGLSLIERILQSRKISNPNKLLEMTIEEASSTKELYGVKKAAKAILKAVEEKKKIFIHGDYDVDGITATAIMWDFLYRKLGADVLPYIPNRFEDGYGLSDSSIKKILAQGGEVVITVDCGIKDIEIVEKFKDKLDFIITDHHTVRTIHDTEAKPYMKQVGEYLISKTAKAVVHPLLNEESFGDICGANVAWKVVLETASQAGIDLDPEEYLDLVAIGTVCDVMPLVDQNRVLVKHGVEKLKKTQNMGLQALIKELGLDPQKIAAHTIGFVIGPRLNAAGRLESAELALKLLCTESERSAGKIAKKLNQLNNERRDMTLHYLNLAEKEISKFEKEKIIFVHGDEWPEGIVGLIAGRLTEKYGKPSLVGSHNNGIVKGSARSIEEYNIAAALKEASQHLLAHGGHKQAAGFSVEYANLTDFIQFLVEHSNQALSQDDIEKKLIIDSLLNPEEIRFENYYEIQKLEPFGFGNRKPVLALQSTTLLDSKAIGSNSDHLKLILKLSNGKILEGIGFNLYEEFNDFFTNHYSTLDKLDVAGYLQEDNWNPNQPKLKLMLKAFKKNNS